MNDEIDVRQEVLERYAAKVAPREYQSALLHDAIYGTHCAEQFVLEGEGI